METQPHKQSIQIQGQKIWKGFTDWWTVPRLIGSLLLGFGLMGPLVNTRVLFSIPVLGDFLLNMSSEFAGIGITILVIDAASEQLVTEREKKRLILQMGSPNNAFAVEAARLLKAQDWGYDKDKTLHKAHLAHADLSRGDLNGVNLQGADLSGALLRETCLNGANLQQASLSQAKLIGAELIGASLVDATLNDASLNNAVLSGADLRRAKLANANLRSQQHWVEHLTAEFKRSGSHSANDSHQLSEIVTGRCTDLSRANLRGADLHGADLHAVNLTDVDLSGANLSGADLSAARLNGAKLIVANLEQADLCGADLGGADLTGANLDNTILRGTKILAEQCEQASSLKNAVLPTSVKIP